MAPSARYVPARSIEKSPTASGANGAPPSTQTCDPSSKPRDDAKSAPSTPSASPSKVARSPSQRDNRKSDVSNYEFGDLFTPIFLEAFANLAAMPVDSRPQHLAHYTFISVLEKIISN